MSKFKLAEDFVLGYEKAVPPFGFDGLGELAYVRTYSRLKPDGKKERWFETVRRVVEGVFEIIRVTPSGGNPSYFMEAEAREMYDKIFHMKFLPPGRGLWAMGTDIVRKNGGAALNNCAFVSTDSIRLKNTQSAVDPFVFAMDALMLGVGVGFDVKGAGSAKIFGPGMRTVCRFPIEDSREGWVESVSALLGSYFGELTVIPEFDYSRIRAAGCPIKTFGGTASGPEALRTLHLSLRSLLDKKVGQNIDATSIVDIFNMIGRCVVAGNVRRSAEIAIGPATDEFMNLKDYVLNPGRMAYGWTSNNTVSVGLDADYKRIASHIQLNGEPGLLWLENMQQYGRFCDGKDYADMRASGGNPCLEITLESKELCCLVETFPNRHKNYQEFANTLYYAFIYAKAVTLVPVHWPESRGIMERNRRIGVSVSGIAQFLSSNSLPVLRDWLNMGYDFLRTVDARISAEWCVPCSNKITCVKPSGTVSLLAGATPGCHLPLSRYYLRRVRLGPSDEYLLAPLRKNGYLIEKDQMVPDGFVVAFPVDVGGGVRTLDDSTMWEQVELAAFLQKYWADNQVSCTVTFDPETEGYHLANILRYASFRLKGISFLPRGDRIYPQMPYQKLGGADYHSLHEKTRPLRLEHEILGGSDPCESGLGLCENDRCFI